MADNKTDNKKKSIHITASDMEQLQSLLDFARPSNKHDLVNFERLEEKLYLATIVVPEDISTDFVRMHSTVHLRETDSDIKVVFTLVFPSDADISSHKISVLAPIGSAVIGQQAGDIIHFKILDRVRRFTIEKVLFEP